jgi:hypothetical protein
MKATAFVVGPEDGPGAVLKQLARQVGFDAVYPFRSVVDAERQSIATPLLYFLFAAAADGIRPLRRVAEQVRRSDSDGVRYSPMIYFSESPSYDVIRNCIELGFDDIITLPVALNRVEERLERQVQRTVVYYETPSYFGPDRHNRIENDPGHAGRGAGGDHRRVEIIRTPTGINVLNDDTQIMI